MRLLTILLLLILTGCGRSYIVDPEIAPYLKEFHIVSIEQGRPTAVDDLDVEIKNDPAEDGIPAYVIAQCSKSYMYKIITVYRKHWDDLGPNQRRGVIFHELGHCQLDRRHKDDMVTDGLILRHASLMSTLFPSEKECTDYKKELDRELFEVKQND